MAALPGLQAKREADAILEAQRQQCTDICAKLAASNALRELQPSPAPGTAADTQDAPGMISPAGMLLTAPAAAVAAITPLAHAGAQGGQQVELCQLLEEDVMEAEEEGAAAQPEQQRQHDDADMDDPEDADLAPHADASPASVAEGRSEQAVGSGAASTPSLAAAAEAAAWGDDAEVAVVRSAEQETGKEAAAATAAAACEATAAVGWDAAGTELMDYGGGGGGADPAQVQERVEGPAGAGAAQPGNGDGGSGSDASVSEGQELAAAEDLPQQAEEQPNAEHARAEYSAETNPQSSGRSQSDDAAEDGEAGAVDGQPGDQVQQPLVAQEEVPSAEQAAAEDRPAPAAGDVPAADQAAVDPQFGLNAVWEETAGEEEQREAEEAAPELGQHQPGAMEQEGVVFVQAEGAVAAEGPENDASQGNLAGMHICPLGPGSAILWLVMSHPVPGLYA